MDQLSLEQILSVVGDLELTRRRQSIQIQQLEARIAELEADGPSEDVTPSSKH